MQRRRPAHRGGGTNAACADGGKMQGALAGLKMTTEVNYDVWLKS